jgi:uncharacterized membrane protein
MATERSDDQQAPDLGATAVARARSDDEADSSAADQVPVQPRGTATTTAPPAADGDSIDVAQDDAGVAPTQPRKRRLLYLTLPGCWGALILACLSYTPSLLPRSGLIQGAVTGISAAIGYGLGVVAAWIWRAFANRDQRRSRPLPKFVFAGFALVALVGSFWAGQLWQSEIRDLMGVTDYNIALAVASPLVAVILFCLLLLVSRGVRGIYRWLVKQLNRWIGPRAAKAVGWIAVVLVAYLTLSGILFNGFIEAANSTFSVRDEITPEGVEQPTTTLRSGGPGSYIAWDSLGREGRKFTGTGPIASDIEEWTHQPAKEPIRAYAGLGTTDDPEARAAIAVQDLERAGGFGRKNLLVVTTTGSGWVDPASVDTFEYLSGGDSAVVAMQYSYLPSWISYLVDQSKAREAGRDLYDAVYDRWSKLPVDQRPQLFVGGESLGSFGAETAFSGEYDLKNRTAGSLFTGPPNFNTLYREFTDHRDAGTPEVLPVYKGGRTVRFTGDPADDIPPGSTWEGNRILYLLHPSDPIVWWSPHLLFSEPDWIDEPPGRDVLEDMTWIPFVSFWQVTADLPFATGVPAGHGHKYTTEYVDGWITVMRPAGVTPEMTQELRGIISDTA